MPKYFAIRGYYDYSNRKDYIYLGESNKDLMPMPKMAKLYRSKASANKRLKPLLSSNMVSDLQIVEIELRFDTDNNCTFVDLAKKSQLASVVA